MLLRCNQDVSKTISLISKSNAQFALLTTFKTDATFENSDIGCGMHFLVAYLQAQHVTQVQRALSAPCVTQVHKWWIPSSRSDEAALHSTDTGAFLQRVLSG